MNFHKNIPPNYYKNKEIKNKKIKLNELEKYLDVECF
jgi:hypothetical protein